MADGSWPTVRRARGSALGCLRSWLMADTFEQVARGMSLDVADDCDPAAVRADHVPLGNCIDGVVGALAVDVWLDQRQETRDGRVVEDDDVVDASDRSDQL